MSFRVVQDTDWGWGGPFCHKGSPRVLGFAKAGDAGTDALRSNWWLGSCEGYVDFLIGGGRDIDRLDVALVRESDGGVLFQATGEDSEHYRRISWDAGMHLGEVLHLQAVDRVTGGWGRQSRPM